MQQSSRASSTRWPIGSRKWKAHRKLNLTGIKTGLEGVTTWELRQILKSDRLLKTNRDFFENGKRLTGNALQSRLEPWR